MLLSLPRALWICCITEPPCGVFLVKSTGSGRSPMNRRMMLHTARAAWGKRRQSPRLEPSSMQHRAPFSGILAPTESAGDLSH